MKKISVLLLAVLLAGCSAAESYKANAQVNLAAGDKLSGELLNLVKGNLALKHAIVAPAAIAWAGVTGIVTDNVCKIQLVNGDVIIGKFTAAPEGKATIESGLSAAKEIFLDNITAINPPPIRWQGDMTLKYSATKGNTDTTDLGVALNAMRESPDDRITVKAAYNYGQSEKVLAKKNGSGKIKYDITLSKCVYGTVNTSGEYDKFQDLALRSSYGLGAGCKVIDAAATQMLIEITGQYTDEDYLEAAGIPDKRFGEGAAALEFKQMLPGGVQFTESAQWNVPFDHTNYWRLKSESALTTKLTTTIAGKIGYILKSNQNPPPGIEKNDEEVYAGITISF